MSSSPAVPAKTTTTTTAKTVLDPAQLDAFVLHLNRCLQTPAGIDAVLGAVCYGARLAALVLGTAGGRALLHEPVRQLAGVLLALPTRASALVLLTSASSSSSSSSSPVATSSKAAAAASALVLAKRLNALGSLMTEARMMLRLWGLLSMYAGARGLLLKLLAQRRAAAAQRKAAAAGAADTSAEEPKTDEAAAAAPPAASTAETLLAWTQLTSCVLFQVTENAAYLSSRGVLGGTPAQQGKLYRWSSQAFSVYVVAELGRLGVQLLRADRQTPAQQAEAAEMHKNFVRYAAMAPVMAHYGMEKGFLGSTALVVLGAIPAALQMHKIWKET